MWDFLFGAVNVVAMLCWAVLLLAPRGDLSRSFVTAAVGWDNLVYGVLLVLFIIYLPLGIVGSIQARLTGARG